jgi:hypothetical protein
MATTKATKLLVTDILPRTSKNEYLQPGLLLMTDVDGKTCWATVSTLSRTYAQFTSLSTPQGIITADSTDSILNIVGTDGINLTTLSNSLYIQGTSFNQISLQGNTDCNLLASNTSNGQINTVLTLEGSDYITIRGNPDSCRLSFDLNQSALFSNLAQNTVTVKNLNVTEKTQFRTVEANAFFGDGTSLTGVAKTLDFLEISNVAMKNAVFTQQTYGSISTFHNSFLDFGKDATISSINTNQVSTMSLTTSQLQTSALQASKITTSSMQTDTLSFGTLSNSLVSVSMEGIGKFQQVESRILTATTTIITPEIVAQSIKGNGDSLSRTYYKMQYASSLQGNTIPLTSTQIAGLWHLSVKGSLSFSTPTISQVNLTMQGLSHTLTVLPASTSQLAYAPFTFTGITTTSARDNFILNISSPNQVYLSDINLTLIGSAESNFTFAAF